MVEIWGRLARKNAMKFGLRWDETLDYAKPRPTPNPDPRNSRNRQKQKDRRRLCASDATRRKERTRGVYGLSVSSLPASRLGAALAAKAPTHDAIDERNARDGLALASGARNAMCHPT